MTTTDKAFAREREGGPGVETEKAGWAGVSHADSGVHRDVLYDGCSQVLILRLVMTNCIEGKYYVRSVARTHAGDEARQRNGDGTASNRAVCSRQRNMSPAHLTQSASHTQQPVEISVKKPIQ